MHLDLGRIEFFKYLTNDTWIRDFSPIASLDAAVQHHGFIFNGWGEKFAHEHDQHFSENFCAHHNIDLHQHDLHLEGGALETNGAGLLMARTSSILNPNRKNPPKEQTEQILQKALAIKSFAWLEHGDLVNDDTDAHIDMLARFCDQRTIAYFSCTDKGYPYYNELSLMKEELELLAQKYNLHLVALPFVYYKESPATYCNFLLTNNSILMPTYNHKNDQKACDILKSLFPGKKLKCIDARALIKQGGAIHCASANIYY